MQRLVGEDGIAHMVNIGGLLGGLGHVHGMCQSVHNMK